MDDFDEDFDYFWHGLPVTWLVRWWRTGPVWEFILVGWLLGLLTALAAVLAGVYALFV